jgi:hypothetical protein
MDPNQPQAPAPYPQATPIDSPQPAPLAPAQPVTPAYQPQPAAQAPQFVPANPAPFATAQPVSAPVADESSKISNPKYWLSVIGIVAAYGILNLVPIINSLLSLVWIGVLILTVIAATKLKSGSGALSEEDKYKMVLLMAASPLVGQAVYYYMLKKQQPAIAKKALSMGWKIFGIEIPFAIVFVIVLGLVIHALAG